jgi:O-antigen ligase
LGAANGGYFETSWGWAAVGLLWLTAVAVILEPPLAPAATQAVFVLGLASLFAWTLASVLWAPAADEPVREAERLLVYLAAALALCFVNGRWEASSVLVGVFVGVVLVSSYSLASVLFREQLDASLTTGRLEEPIGYWNGLGIFAVLGVLIALGFVARGRTPVACASAAASLVLLMPVIHFTYSRGAWLAMSLGMAVAIAVDPDRSRLLAALVVVGPAPALAVYAASRAGPVADLDARMLGFELLLFAAGAAVLGLSFHTLRERIVLRRALSRLVAWGLALGAVSAAALVAAAHGGPLQLAQDAWGEFKQPAPTITADPDSRLFDVSSLARYQQWQVAGQMVDDHNWLGGGAGGYESYWTRHRPVEFTVRDAHSLYLETLAELGPVGLGLLLVALGAPVVAGVRARRHLLVPTALGAYAAYLAHAGIDWDWELPAVTLAAILCAGAILRFDAGTRPPLTADWRTSVAAVTVALGACGLVALIGNGAMDASAAAIARSDWTVAEQEARKAERWAPWSSRPWQLLGQAELAQGHTSAARDAFLEALERNGHDWELWVALAGSAEGKERRAALAAATALNPFLRRQETPP